MARVTTLSDSDRAALARVLRVADGRIRVPSLGAYKAMSADDVWFAIVSQVCVMGSSRGMEAIVRDPTRRESFGDAIRPASLQCLRSPASRLAEVLTGFKATRFPTKAATTLASLLNTATVFAGERLALLDDLPKHGAPDPLRGELRRRCPVFNLKSASDFMINIGLSDDVIALDTRVVGALRRYFGFNLPVSVVQSKRAVYLSVESTLRDACAELGFRSPCSIVPSGRTALDFVMEGQ